MCTAISLKTKDFYFGRNLDYEFSYGEEIVIAPRNYPFFFRHEKEISHHLALIGVAHIANGYPLYYDAMNEAGLGMAGLNFVGNAHYCSELSESKNNIAQFELIPWILSQAKTVKEAKKLIEKINIVDTPFSDKLPPSELHYIITDKDDCVVLESIKESIRVYDNPIGVLTNNPPFDEQLFWLNRYMNLSRKEPKNQFSSLAPLHTFSRGMGAIGLPGDLSSPSRFAKVAFTKLNSVSPTDELSSVSQFFHILQSVEQQCGVAEVKDNEYEITIYSTCYNGDKGICYYTSYGNRRINAIDMKKENIDGDKLISFPMNLKEDVLYQN